MNSLWIPLFMFFPSVWFQSLRNQRHPQQISRIFSQLAMKISVMSVLLHLSLLYSGFAAVPSANFGNVLNIRVLYLAVEHFSVNFLSKRHIHPV